MHVAFFLTPKAEVVCLSSRSTVRQALEKMEHHRYQALPLLDGAGRYVGTLTEGDLLGWMKRQEGPWMPAAEHAGVHTLARQLNYRAMRIDAEMEQLVALASDQNFVPVIDDREVFVGIVRRGHIISYCAKFLERAAAARDRSPRRDYSGG